MNEVIKLGLTLMIITLVAAIALALTNNFTMPYVEKNKEIAIKESLNLAYPEADDFEQSGDFYLALKDGERIGKVFSVGSAGYSSIVELLVGVNNDNIIEGVAVVAQQETPGLGAKVVLDDFLSQFKGKKLDEAKLRKDDGNIDAITGATITSSAAISAIQTIHSVGVGVADDVEVVVENNLTKAKNDEIKIDENKVIEIE